MSLQVRQSSNNQLQPEETSERTQGKRRQDSGPERTA